HIITFMRSLLTQGTKWRLYILGLCNGLLPCGIVYYFLLTAAIAGNGVNGAIVMGIFGLMTIPSLLLLGLVSSSLQNKRLLFLRLSGATMVGFGLYEIYKASKSLGLLPFF
ncbi:MAG: sulfite exporter TauE/SafE family protein, partial [Helicobacter japonicus]|nr:sulfite exporter TauE/SafE family protein [Helicobacter japonicus]